MVMFNDINGDCDFIEDLNHVEGQDEIKRHWNKERTRRNNVNPLRHFGDKAAHSDQIALSPPWLPWHSKLQVKLYFVNHLHPCRLELLPDRNLFC